MTIRRHSAPRLAIGSWLVMAILFWSASHASPAAGAPTSAWLQGWPMFGHDPQRTNRSPIEGPVRPRLLWSLAGVQVTVVGPDGTMYGCRGTSTVAISPSGKTLWASSPCLGPTALAPNGTLLSVGSTRTPGTSSDEAATGLGPSGALAWKIQPFGQLKGAEPLVTSQNLFYVPVIGPHDGSPAEAYIGLNIISAGGTVIRRLWDMAQLAAGPTGTLYSSSGNGIVAANSDGKVLWQHSFSAGEATEPLVGRDQTVYVVYGRSLAAYRPSGRLLWRLDWPDQPLTLAERGDGVLLVAGRRELGAVNANGRVLWRVKTGPAAAQDRAQWPALVVDAADTAYVGTGDGVVRVFSRDGKLEAHIAGGGPGNSIFLSPYRELVVDGVDDVLRAYAGSRT